MNITEPGSFDGLKELWKDTRDGLDDLLNELAKEFKPKKEVPNYELTDKEIKQLNLKLNEDSKQNLNEVKKYGPVFLVLFTFLALSIGWLVLNVKPPIF